MARQVVHHDTVVVAVVSKLAIAYPLVTRHLAREAQVVLHVEQTGELFDVPLTVTLQYADRREAQVIVPVTERVVDLPVALTGTLRGVDISRDDGTMAEVTK